MANIEIGQTSILATNDSNFNGIVSQLAVLSEDATIQTISLHVITAAGNIRLAIYDATGTSGGPGALKAQTASTAATGPNIWNIVPVVTPVLLSAANYWLAVQQSSASLVTKAQFSGASSANQNSFAYATFPSTFTIHSTASNQWSISGQLTTVDVLMSQISM